MIFDKDSMNKEKTLTVKEICSIIKECSSNDVSSLEFGSLKLTFKEKKEVEEVTIPDTFQSHESELTDSISEIDPELSELVRRETERDLKAIQAMNANLEDPFLAEQMALRDDQLDDLADNLEG